MIKMLGVAVATALMATASVASADFLQLPPGSYNGFKSIDGAAYIANGPGTYNRSDYVGQSSYYSYPNGFYSNAPTVAHNTNYMAAVEYDLSTLPQNINITSAVLGVSVTTQTFYAFGPFTIVGTEYAGDGTVTAADVMATGIPFSVTGNNYLRLDATSFVQSLVAAGDSYAGFNFSMPLPNGCALQTIGIHYCDAALQFFSTVAATQGNLTIGYTVVAPIGDANSGNASAVPEPAAWVMMIVGMGMIGFALRRQKVTFRVRYAA